MAIMPALGDSLGYRVPDKANNKAMQLMLNIYDIFDESIAKRGSITTLTEARSFIDNRMKQFFVSIEAGYKMYPGSLFYGEHPSFVDFQLLGTLIILDSMFGKDAVMGMLTVTAPTVVAAAAVMSSRPNIKAFIDGGFKGEYVMPASMNLGFELLTA